jgi:hypothetical protein
MILKNFLLRKRAFPEVSRWNGMSFRIQYPPKEHNPPHFHVRIGEGSGKGTTYSINIWDLKPTERGERSSV